MIESVRRAVQIDDLILPGNEWMEVVDGIMVEKNTMTGFAHSVIVDNMVELLKPNVKQHKSGHVFGDGLTYALHIDENGVRTARIPDVSFIRHVPEFDRKRPFPGAPDLAVEVVSPTETTIEVMEKVLDSLRYGTEQVWVLYPASQELYQYLRDDNEPHLYRAADTLTAAALFPGLTILVADLFKEAT